MSKTYLILHEPEDGHHEEMEVDTKTVVNTKTVEEAIELIRAEYPAAVVRHTHFDGFHVTCTIYKDRFAGRAAVGWEQDALAGKQLDSETGTAIMSGRVGQVTTTSQNDYETLLDAFYQNLFAPRTQKGESNE